MIERDEYIQRCFRRQYPELYNRASIETPDVPPDLRYGAGGTASTSAEGILEREDQGRPDAVELVGATLMVTELALAGSKTPPPPSSPQQIDDGGWI